VIDHSPARLAVQDPARKAMGASAGRLISARAIGRMKALNFAALPEPLGCGHEESAQALTRAIAQFCRLKFPEFSAPARMARDAPCKLDVTCRDSGPGAQCPPGFGDAVHKALRCPACSVSSVTRPRDGDYLGARQRVLFGCTHLPLWRKACRTG